MPYRFPASPGPKFDETTGAVLGFLLGLPCSYLSFQIIPRWQAENAPGTVPGPGMEVFWAWFIGLLVFAVGLAIAFRNYYALLIPALSLVFLPPFFFLWFVGGPEMVRSLSVPYLGMILMLMFLPGWGMDHRHITKALMFGWPAAVVTGALVMLSPLSPLSFGSASSDTVLMLVHSGFVGFAVFGGFYGYNLVMMHRENPVQE